MDIAQLAQAEAVATRRVHVAVHCHDGARRGHLEGLTDLHVHLEVGDGAPVLRGCRAKSTVRLAASDSVKVFTHQESLILTRVVGYGGLEGYFVRNRPCDEAL